MTKPLVGVVMGSDSDLNVMEDSASILKEFEIPYELTIVSAHRTPERMAEYATTARERGLKVIIAGAGGAAHLPGMLAAQTTLPVIGVPVKSTNSIDGWDSLLSIVQMPKGVPVATVALNGATNAGILAVQIISVYDADVAKKLATYREDVMKKKVLESIELTKSKHPNNFDV